MAGTCAKRFARINYLFDSLRVSGAIFLLLQIEEGAMDDDRTFYERRLREELERARVEPDVGMRLLHTHWAELYRQRLCGASVTSLLDEFLLSRICPASDKPDRG